MSLVLSSSPENNNSTTSTPVFQDWAPVNGINYFWSGGNYAPLTPGVIEFKIKDVVYNPLSVSAEVYTEFRLKAYQAYGEGNPIDWIDPDSISAGGYPTDISSSIPLTENGVEFNFTPVIQNLELLDVGVYSFTSYFVIEGLNEIGAWSQVSAYSHTITLTIATTNVFYSPPSLSYQHTQGGTLPSKVIAVSGSSWVVVAPPHIELSSATFGVVIDTVTPEEGEPYQTAAGNGTAVINATLTDYYDGDYDESSLLTQLQIFTGSTLAGIIPISIVVESNMTFWATPQTLNFTAIKEIQEPTPQYILYFCSEPPFTITCSPWLTAELDTIDINGILTEVIKVIPMATANMEIGQYVGFVKLQDTIDSEPYLITIDVNYDLQGFIQSPYPVGNKAFTLDPLFFNFYSVYANTYFQLQAKIKWFDFFSNEFKEKTIYEKLPAFNGRAQLNYGLAIHKLMDRFAAYNENLFQYKPAEFTLFVQEILISNSSVIRSALLPTIKFVAGLSRAMVVDKALLEFNLKPARVTKKSFYFLNILVPDFNYELRIFKNNVLHQTIRLPYPDGKILCKKISFSTYNHGDVVRVSLNQEGDIDSEVPEKIFYVIPEGKYSNHITWEDEYLLQSALECTGALMVKPEFEFKSNLVYQNLVEILEYLETKKTGKLFINTGWIINSHIDDIESLLRSRRVWLQLGDKRISLRPITKTIVTEDTERELIEYALEFQINPSYDQETYSR